MHLPSLCTEHRTVPEIPATLFSSADQNTPNSKDKLCGVSWEKWAKSIAYAEAIFGTLTVVVIPVFLMELSSVKDDLVLQEDSTTNVFNNDQTSYLFVIMAAISGIFTTKITESHFSFVKGYNVTLFILQLAFTTLAIFIVVGVTKKNLKHIIHGIFMKMGLMVLSLILFLSQLIVQACCGYGSDILERLLIIVGDAFFIMVLNNYLKCERDALVASNQNGQLPKFLFGLLNSMFSIKIPYLMGRK